VRGPEHAKNEGDVFSLLKRGWQAPLESPPKLLVFSPSDHSCRQCAVLVDFPFSASLPLHTDRRLRGYSQSPMTRGTINFDSVRKIGLALPGVDESTAYGSPALKVRGKLLTCLPAHRSAEPGSLVVRVGSDDRAELLATAPDVYYVTDHYLNYTAVLVRLSRVTPDVLRDLLGMAHKFVTARRQR
jgi:hypothetical protein